MKGKTASRACKNCRYSWDFYGEFAFRFKKHRMGYCIRRQASVLREDVCEQYGRRKPAPAPAVTAARIDEAIEDVRALVRIFGTPD